MAASAYLIDVTRLVSRVGRGALTGIDRVELAYARHFLAQQTPLFALLRWRFGYVLLDRRGLQDLADIAEGGASLPCGWGVVSRVLPPKLRLALALRRAAIARCRRKNLATMLGVLGKGAVYLNTGHANLGDAALAAIKGAGVRVLVLIHDTIPLDYPQFSRAEIIPAFAAKIAATARHADGVIHISQDARAKTEAHFAAHGRVPRGVTAHLGVALAAPTPRPSIPPISPNRPYFVALGTVEPRKNHRLLLDIWQEYFSGPSAPQLVIIGNKGWAGAAVFDQMAALIASGAVIHAENLPDGAVAHLLQGARALLFPTLAEGFGLPPLEAAGLGTRVIASDLPVLRETCGAFPVYLDPLDSYSWMETIKSLAAADLQGQSLHKNVALPLWADHFKTVLTLNP